MYNIIPPPPQVIQRRLGGRRFFGGWRSGGSLERRGAYEVSDQGRVGAGENECGGDDERVRVRRRASVDSVSDEAP